MTALVLDVETTTFKKGNPFAKRNSLCYVGAYPEGGNLLVGNAAILPNVRREIDAASCIVGFNSKFDLHWIRRAGETSYKNRRIWDCQLAHFLLSAQRERYPSLQGVCAHHKIPGKLGIVEEYWSKGIDTLDIPQDIMLQYLCGDLIATMEVYKKQQEEFKANPKLFNLFNLQCADLLVLADMEWNGLLVNTEEMLEEAEEIKNKINKIERELEVYTSGCPVNWDSVPNVSAVLYGGTISIDNREIAGVYKTGSKAGQPRFRIVTKEYVFPRLLEPLERSELAKEGCWSTDEATLRSLRDRTGITKLLLERGELTKQLDYYEGWPKLIKEMDWPENEVHGQLNQVVTRTGRLSATKPNQQNVPEDFKRFIISRFN